uniref:Uncharacterized protein n=1 Tax=Caenorhabditis japonica TaxID=281687 RepID=A0A8R1INX7_CAEJA
MRFLIVLFLLTISTVVLGQWQWHPFQLVLYFIFFGRELYNHFFVARFQPQPQAPQPAAAPASAPGSNVQHHPIWGRVESDDKGNMWVGDDVAKLQIVSRYSPP